MPRIALVQINPTVGDLENNAAAMQRQIDLAHSQKAELIVFPKGALTGMPLGDLETDVDFLARAESLSAKLFAGFPVPVLCDEVVQSDPAWINPAARPLTLAVDARPVAMVYRRGGPAVLVEHAKSTARNSNSWVVLANLVGGQDTCVYAGGSVVANPSGDAHVAALFREDLLVVDTGDTVIDNAAQLLSGTEELYEALVLAVRDYIDKSRLPGAAVSLSGGIDSAVVAALAVDALGPERVRCLTLPGPFTSAATLADAKLLAANLGVPIREISIVPAYETARDSLRDVLADGPSDPEDLAGQNLQARLRGAYIMALANRLGYLTLNCSNKSEALVGYGTLYGDMIGGFSPLRDVYKTDVWKLARFANERAGRERIPVSIIDRVPSAELRRDQEDRQSLPDYPVLDAILAAHVDRGEPFSAVAGRDFPAEEVKKTFRLNQTSAFKRLQAPFGPIVTSYTGDSETTGLPIVNRFRPWA